MAKQFKTRGTADGRLINNKKDYFKQTSQQSYVAQTIFRKDLVAIYKIKTTLADNKLAYAGICTLELRKVPMYVEFHCDYIKKNYDDTSRLLFTETDSLVSETETKNVYENFSRNSEMFDFSNHSAKSKYYNDSNTGL